MTKKNKAKNITTFIAIAVIALSLPTFFYIYFMNRVYPGVFVAGINLSGKSYNESVSLLTSKVSPIDNLTLTFQNKTYKIPVSNMNLTYNFNTSAKRAILLGRSGNPYFDINQILDSINHKTNYGLEFTIDEKVLDKEISKISGEVSVDPVSPTFQISGSKLILSPGKTGSKIDIQRLNADIHQNLSMANSSQINIQSLEDKVDKESFIENAVNKVAAQIDIDPINAKFTFENNHVEAFTPESNGVKVDEDKLKSEISDALATGSPSVDIPTIPLPAIVKTSDINNLGINELIGSGTSHFAGSAYSRAYNINLAASRINNTLIAPGQVFSFDNIVGDISKLNGYLEAYVIQNGQTVLGDGGGVCQVSTTMFRAAMNSGLPIVERHAHAYRVHYYEEDAPPGLDATIYTPNIDFKFKNDTENFILIQTQIDLRNMVLTFNIYGTKDGRVANITKPTLWDYKPAPADSYTDDPTLPVGTIKQIDFAATGIKSQFEYTVTNNGKTINHQIFFSDFTPWQAKFLRGTKAS